VGARQQREECERNKGLNETHENGRPVTMRRNIPRKRRQVKFWPVWGGASFLPGEYEERSFLWYSELKRTKTTLF
jgi:hypothetical protein